MITVRHFITVGSNGVGGITGYEEFLSSGNDVEPMVPVEDDDPALIMYTSGTTGRPKGAVLTHKNKMVNCINCVIELGLRSDDVYLCVPPLFHTAALAVMLMMVFLGGKTVMVRMFEPTAVIETAYKEKVTLTFLVPAMWNTLLMVPDLGEKMNTLRIAITGAAKMPLSLKHAVLKAISGVGLVDAFGQTEMSPVKTLLKPEDTLRKGSSVGRPVVNVEVRVVDDEGKEVPAGQVGEIVYRGPTMLKEYYRDPEATARAVRDGWFHSGDLVRVDDEGKDMVISGGENVYPAEVEEVLYKHEKVLEGFSGRIIRINKMI